MIRLKRWGVYKANLDPVIGSEQGKTRPVLVISENEINDILSIVNVLPITTRKIGRRIYPNEALLDKDKFILPNESIVLCHQIRTLDKQRLSTEYGFISDLIKQNEILAALKFQLGIE